MDTTFPHNQEIAGSNPLQLVTPQEHTAPLPPPLPLPATLSRIWLLARSFPSMQFTDPTHHNTTRDAGWLSHYALGQLQQPKARHTH